MPVEFYAIGITHSKNNFFKSEDKRDTSNPNPTNRNKQTKYIYSLVHTASPGSP